MQLSIPCPSLITTWTAKVRRQGQGDPCFLRVKPQWFDVSSIQAGYENFRIWYIGTAQCSCKKINTGLVRRNFIFLTMVNYTIISRVSILGRIGIEKMGAKEKFKVGKGGKGIQSRIVYVDMCVYMCVPMHTFACMWQCICICMCAHTYHACVYTWYACRYVQVFMYIVHAHTCAMVHRHICAYMHMCACGYMYMHAYLHVGMFMCACASAYMHMCEPVCLVHEISTLCPNW